MSLTIYLYGVLLAALVWIIYLQTQLDERDRLLAYYRQPGQECTLGEDPLVVCEPVPATLTWRAQEGRLVVMLTHPADVLVYLPEEETGWVTLERHSDFVRSRDVHRLVGQPRVLLKWRLESRSLVG